jgi:hypothetical protein
LATSSYWAQHEPTPDLAAGARSVPEHGEI